MSELSRWVEFKMRRLCTLTPQSHPRRIRTRLQSLGSHTAQSRDSSVGDRLSTVGTPDKDTPPPPPPPPLGSLVAERPPTWLEEEDDDMAAALKLSPALKQLIKLPAARGAPVPAPAPTVLSSLFDRVRSTGEAGGIGRDTWLSMNTSALFAINSPDALCALYEYATKGNEVKDKVRAVAVMRESGLKSISFTGIPKVINNLNALRDHIPDDVKDGLYTKPLREPHDIAALYKRGIGLWDGIYEPKSAKLINKLHESHPDLPVHILNSHYGPLLSDPPIDAPEGSFLLGRVLTSVIAIAGLRAQTGVGPQVTSHVFGLKKALLQGGGGDGRQLQGQEWLTSDEGVTWVLKSVDEIGAVMRGEKMSDEPSRL